MEQMMKLQEKMDCVNSKTIVNYGIKLQSVVCMEEMSELIKEVSKFIRGSGSKENLTEEMADVYICLDLLQLMYNLDDEDLLLTINQKLDRLEGRINEHTQTDIHSTQMW